MVALENYERRAPGRSGILTCAIARVKNVAVSESRKIAQKAYLGLITIIESNCEQKLEKEQSREVFDISLRDKLLEKNCCHIIARNHTCSILRPNNEY